MNLLPVLALLLHSAQAAPVPGTRVDLKPPKTFEMTGRFPGFISETYQASIMVNEMPAPYGQTVDGFTAEGFKARGVKLLSREERKVGGKKALLLNIEQSAQGQTFRKWVLAVDHHGTVLLTLTFPADAPKTAVEDGKKALLQAKFGEKIIGSAVTFRIDPAPGFEQKQTLGNGMVIALKDESAYTEMRKPFFVSAASLSQSANIPNRKEFAENRAKNTATIREVKPAAATEIKLDGLSGFEIQADAKDEKTGRPVKLLQVMLFDQDGYYLMGGVADAKDEATTAAFRAMARSFARLSK